MKGFLKEKKCDEKVRTNCIQTMIRVGLVLIQMMIVGCLTVRAELQEENMEMIEKKLEYRNLENGESFPQEIEVQVKTGQGTKGVLCHAEEQKVTGEYWLEDFSFPVTFHRYHSDYYRLGELLVPFQEEKPKLEGCESELLRQLGLSPDAYEILDFQWQGGTYLGKDGTICHDGIGTGRRLVRDYLVTYRGTCEKTEDAEPLQEITEKKPDSGSGSQGEDLGESREDTPGKFLSFWKKAARFFLIAIGIGSIFFLGGLLLLGLLWVEKYLRKWYNSRN